MSIGNTSLAIDLLNAASTWVANVAAGSAHQLRVGGVYTLSGLGEDTHLGFGPSQATAITDGDADHGEPLPSTAPPRVLVVDSTETSWVGCSGGDLRIRENRVTP